jgi:hypothetical protein
VSALAHPWSDLRLLPEVEPECRISKGLRSVDSLADNQAAQFADDIVSAGPKGGAQRLRHPALRCFVVEVIVLDPQPDAGVGGMADELADVPIVNLASQVGTLRRMPEAGARHACSTGAALLRRGA